MKYAIWNNKGGVGKTTKQIETAEKSGIKIVST
jgi:cellulose biosynthesis protein BcsQ